MPIRFRCVYCKQLMGISRRKAGSVVRCPKCAHQVMVPPDAEAAKPAVAERPAPVFERSDFDELIQQAAPQPVRMFDFDAVPVAEPSEHDQPPEAKAEPPVVGVEQAVVVDEAPTAAAGILLSPSMATALAVCVIVGLAVAFVLGLYIGYRWH